MKRFVTQTADLSDWQPDAEYPLPEDVAHHVIHVMRMGAGDTLELMDRAQHLVSAKINREGNVVCLSHTQCTASQRRFSIHLGIALIKWPRFEWMLEKVAEIGIARLTPLCCERSVIKVQDWSHKSERLQKIITEAARQSLNPIPPELCEPQKIQAFVTQGSRNHCYFAHLGDYPRLEDVASGFEGEVRFIVGPEGGFSPEEVVYLSDHATPFSLGAHVLRAETAAIACAMTQVFF